MSSYPQGWVTQQVTVTQSCSLLVQITPCFLVQKFCSETNKMVQQVKALTARLFYVLVSGIYIVEGEN